MRALVLTAALALGLGLGVVPAQAADPAPAPAPDLASLRASLTASTARAQALADALEQAAARDGGLRTRLQDLAQESDDAQARLDARVRSVWIHGAPDPLGDLVERISSPTLPRAVAQGLSASVRTQRDLVDAVGVQSTRVKALQAQAAAYRAGLRSRALAVLGEQDRARALLAAAEQEAAREAVRAADAAAAAAEQARLQEVAVQLDAVSASVTRSLSPAQTARGRRAQEQEAPLIALLDAAGSGYPAGYAPTGQVVRGTASWYGPGFVGSPTASGAPYDPELLTCAHKTLPLLTVLRVSANGRTVSCLVTDRGPYVGTRVIDMSRAGSRALGYDGTAEVVAEVLAPS